MSHTQQAKRGEAGGPDEKCSEGDAVRRRTFVKRQMQRGQRCLTMPAALLSKDERCLIVMLHACRALVLSCRVTRLLFQPLPDASTRRVPPTRHSRPSRLYEDTFI